MIMNNSENFFLKKIVSFGLGKCGDSYTFSSVDWECLWKMASQQGVSAICLDGLQILDKGSGCLTI